MSASGHAIAMHACIADSCRQGKDRCPRPMTCSGATPLVDESIDLFQLHRLQEVRAVDERWDAPRSSAYHHLTRPLAPGVIEGPDDASDFLRQENCLFGILRIALPYLAALAAVGLLAARAMGWI